MRRHFIIFSFLVLAVLLCSASAFAEGEPTIIASGTCGTNATWTLDSDGLLTVSGSGEMANYSSPDSYGPAPWAADHLGDIKSVIIGGGITSIGSSAFEGCWQLSFLDIQEDVTRIESSAFYMCSGLKEIILPDSITRIGSMAFWNCSGLETIKLPENLNDLGSSVFQNCTSLESITLPGSLKTVTNITFDSCSSLKRVDITYGVESINSNAFSNCDALQEILFPSSLKTIGSWAFSNCFSLASVEIPASVSSIGDSAFAGCTKLSSIQVDQGNNDYCTVNEALLNKSKTELIEVPCACGASFSIPYGVIKIHPYALYRCAANTVIIPKTVSNVQYYAFSDCNSLQDVYYLGTSTNWQSVSIASNNTALTNATMHYPQYSGTCGTSATWSFFNDGLMVISGTGAMTNYSSSSSTPWSSYLYNIKAIIVDHGITHIGNNAFRSSSAESLTIQDASLSMGNYCFAYNTHLTDIDFGTGTIIPASCVFEDCTALESVHIPANVVMNGSYSEDGSGYDMFHSCSALKTAVVDCAYIGPFMFETDKALESVTFTDPDVRFYYLESDPQRGDPFNSVMGTSSAPKVFDVIGYTCSNVPSLLSQISSYGRTIHFVPIEGDPGHRDVVIDAAVEATCETDGLTEGSHCAACGIVFVSQQTIPALGHDWGEWSVIREATCAEEGEEQRICNHDASHVETSPIAKLPHDPAGMVIENSVDPTCTETGGYDEVIYCNVCNEELSRESKVVDALGHNYQIIYGWEDDNSSVTAVAICRRDSSHVVTETVTVTSEVTKPATEYEMGETTYTAAFVNDIFETQTKVVADIEQLVPVYKTGDADGDGKVNAIDRMILSRYLAGWAGVAEQIKDLNALDINKDGKVNAKDRMILARYLADWGEPYDSYFKE